MTAVSLTFTSPAADQVLKHLRHANRIAEAALQQGHHPFGALLVGPDHEAVLARHAAQAMSPEALWGCTLYTTVEPCAMCAGTQYWAHICRVVYGLCEHRLLTLTGSHPENPTLDLPCREVFARGQKAIEVIGPVAAVEEEIATLHRLFWRRVG